MTGTDFPDFWADVEPERPAYIMAGSGRVVTYQQLVHQSRRLAHLIRGHGLRHGDCAALLLDNVPGALEVAWACQRSGLRYTTISTRLTAREVRYILSDCGARILFTCSARAALAADAAHDGTDVGGIYSVDGPDGPIPGIAVATEHLPALPAEDEAEGVDLLYSSGTTGFPKGVEAELALAPIGTPPGVAALLRSRWAFDRHTVYLSPAPLYHAAPLRFNMTVQRFGGTSVMMEKFDAAQTLQLISRYRITHTQMVPTMFVRLLRLPEDLRRAADLSSLRYVIHAAAPCPPEIKRQMIEWMGPVIEEYFSTTELNLFTAITSAEALERPGSVGRPLIGVPHILGDEGNPVAAGEIGIIWSEGGFPFVYHNDPERTRAARNELGWTTVGDIGYLDEAGYLYPSDRRTDLIISGGVNIYPQEVENVLILHPAVADVAVFGVPNDEFGQEVKAVVQPAGGTEPGADLEQELLVFCASRLSQYKCPRTIDFRDSLPRQPTGKLYKRLLRDEYRAAREAGASGKQAQ